MTYDEYVFVDIESESFKVGCSFEDYKRDVVRYLMLCSYGYSEEDATALANKYINDLKKSFVEKEPVADLAIDIGYACG